MVPPSISHRIILGPAGRWHGTGMVRVSLLLAGALVVAVPALAGPTLVERGSRKATLRFDGTIVIENPQGSLQLTGTDARDLDVRITKKISGDDDLATQEGAKQTDVLIGGDEKARIVRTVIGRGTRRWTPTVDFVIKVPRTVHVKIVNNRAEKIRITNIYGTVELRNLDGQILLENLHGPVNVESINGSISLTLADKPTAHVTLFSVNGPVEVKVPAGSSFEWLSETLKGDVLSNLPLRASVALRNGNRVIRARVGDGIGPTLSTASLMNQIVLLSGDSAEKIARSLEIQAPQRAQSNRSQVPRAANPLPQAQQAQRFSIRQDSHLGNLRFETSLGDIVIGDIRGSATILTRGGEVSLGTVHGRCEVESGGGPIHLGDIIGPLNAHTSAGSVTVSAARKGGTVVTDGGSIDILFAGAPINARSGGGDVTVRRAASGVTAESHKGDVSITMDPQTQSARITAEADRGNVVLNLPPRFGAEIDATIITSADAPNPFTCEFPGLSVVRERDGNRLKIRATGSINGGGERVEIRATGGDVIIRSTTVTAGVGR